MGRLVMGKIAERLGNRRLIKLCLAGVAVGLELVWSAPNRLFSAVGLLIAGFSFALSGRNVRAAGVPLA